MAAKLKPYNELNPKYRKQLLENYELNIIFWMKHVHPNDKVCCSAEYYRTGGRFSRYVHPSDSTLNVFHQVNIYSDNKSTQATDLHNALEWIQERTEGKWTMRILAGRFSDNGRPVTQFWFEDLSEAAMFRLRF